MANEAILRDRLENPIDFTCADSDAFEKGAVVKLIDPRKVSGSGCYGAPAAGIIAREKIANDGRTQVPVFRRGIFDMVCSGAINVGNKVILAGDSHSAAGASANRVVSAGSFHSGACILGTALEDATNNEVFQVYVNVGD